MNKEKLHIAIVILADAENTQLGPNQYNLAWGNSTVLGQTIKEVVKTQINDLYVVLGASFEETFIRHKHFPVHFIKNSNWEQKETLDLKWILSQMKLFELDGILFLNSLQPELDSLCIKELMATYQKNQASTVTKHARGFGLPALLDMDLVTNLKNRERCHWDAIFSKFDLHKQSFKPNNDLYYIEDLGTYLQKHNDWFGEVNPI